MDDMVIRLPQTMTTKTDVLLVVVGWYLKYLIKIDLSKHILL